MSVASPHRDRRGELNDGVLPPPRSSGTSFGTIAQVVVILLLLPIIACMLLMLFLVASIMNAPGQLAGGIGNQVGAVASQVGSAASSIQQSVQDVTDPNHPPTGLAYDTEFSSLEVWQVGDHLPPAGHYVLVLQSIQRRQNAPSTDTALYAVVHVELRQPNEARLFGQVLRSDSDPHDYALYKGETFRIGRAIYRVNWISQQSNAMAAGTYRNPDGVNAPLKFAYD